MIKVLLIANPKSGILSYEDSLNIVISNFKKYDIEYTLSKTEYAGHAVNLVNKTDLKQYDSVCAMGGDGTLFEVLNGMLTRSENERIPISIIPSGTGNSFMKTVSIENVVDAVGKISKNEPKKLDMMRAVCGENIYYSLNLIGWGMATDISVLAEKLRFFGGQRYNIASVFEIIKNKRRDSKLIIDGKERDGAYSFIIACNTKYVGKDMRAVARIIRTYVYERRRAAGMGWQEAIITGSTYRDHRLLVDLIAEYGSDHERKRTHASKMRGKLGMKGGLSEARLEACLNSAPRYYR